MFFKTLFAIFSLYFITSTLAFSQPNTSSCLLSRLNDQFRGLYKQRKEARLIELFAQGDPIILQYGDEMELIYKGKSYKENIIPTLYSNLKVIGHVALTFHLLLEEHSPTLMNDLQSYLDELKNIKKNMNQLFGQDPSLAKMVMEYLENIFHKVEEILVQKSVPPNINDFFPTLKEATFKMAKIAGDAQRNAANEAFRKWEQAPGIQLDDSFKKNVTIIVGGPHWPKEGNLMMGYFSQKFGLEIPKNPHQERQLLYAEKSFSREELLDLLASMKVDQRMGEAFFGDRHRMQKDLLERPATETNSKSISE